MEKDKILLIGLGQCGNQLVNEMINKNKRYAGVFINSSLGDLAKINNANSNNTFIFNGTDGAGRNRRLAQTFIQNDIMRLSTFLLKFSQFKTYVVMSSLDGGSGSGSLPLVVKTLKEKLFKNSIVNVVGVLPRLNEDNLKLQNTLDCLVELEKVLPSINNIRFINNETRKSYAEINSEALSELDMCYGITGKHEEDSIDLQDSYNINTCPGYGFSLVLPDRFRSVDEAIQIAKESSVFALPNSFDCVYGAVNVKENVYNREDLKAMIKADETVYTTYNNNKMNIIAFAGCDMPSESIELIKLELEDRRSSKKERNIKKGFGVSLDSTINNQSIPSKPKMDVIEDEDIDDMFDADFFRF